MEILFENVCVRNRDVTKEIYGYYYFRRRLSVVLNIILALALLGNAAAFLLEGETANWYVTVFLAAFFAFQIINYYKTVKTVVMRFEETGQTQITTTVTDEFMQITSPGGATGKMEYCHVNKVFQTKNLIILETKAKLFYVFAKDGFTKGSSQEFIAFLQTKGIKIK